MQTTLYIDPVTGGYLIDKNVLVSVDPVVNKANVLLSTPIGSYIYNLKIGNPLLGARGLLSRSDITNGITTALNPLLQSNEVTSVEVLRVSLDPLFKYNIDIKLTYPSGKDVQLTWVRPNV